MNSHFSNTQNASIKMEVPVTIHPHVITDKIDTSDDDGTTQDSIGSHGSYPELIDYILGRDRSRRSIVTPQRYYNSLFASKYVCDDLNSYALFVVSELYYFEPKTFNYVINSSDASNWLNVIQDEFNSFIKNKTWVFVKIPKNAKVLDSRWLFKIKQGIKGFEPSRFKVRLVAQGFAQK